MYNCNICISLSFGIYFCCCHHQLQKVWRRKEWDIVVWNWELSCIVCGCNSISKVRSEKTVRLTTTQEAIHKVHIGEEKEMKKYYSLMNLLTFYAAEHLNMGRRILSMKNMIFILINGNLCMRSHSFHS